MSDEARSAAQGRELSGTDGSVTCTCPDFKGPVDTRHVCDVHGPLYSDDAELSGTDRSAATPSPPRADWSDVNALTRRIWIVREGVWTWRVPLKPSEYAALLDENERLRDALDALRAAWNAHMDGCPVQGPTIEPPSEADLAAWRDAPSGTASA